MLRGREKKKNPKTHQPDFYPAKLFFTNEGWEKKTFPDEQKWREFIANRPALQEIVRGILQAKSRWPRE